MYPVALLEVLQAYRARDKVSRVSRLVYTLGWLGKWSQPLANHHANTSDVGRKEQNGQDAPKYLEESIARNVRHAT